MILFPTKMDFIYIKLKKKIGRKVATMSHPSNAFVCDPHRIIRDHEEAVEIIQEAQKAMDECIQGCRELEREREKINISIAQLTQNIKNYAEIKKRAETIYALYLVHKAIANSS